MNLQPLSQILSGRKFCLTLALLTLILATAGSGSGRATPQAIQGDPYMVRDFNPAGSSSPRNLVAMNGTLFFVTDFSGTETLWKSDGTDAGTASVKELTNPQPGDNLIDGLTISGSALFFSADPDARTYDLWKTDGTLAGTVMVKAIGSDEPFYSSLDNLTDVNGTLYFGAREDEMGKRLWKSDGTQQGTIMVKGDPLEVDTSTSRFIHSGSQLYFVGSNNPGPHVYKLWQSDGTPDGTLVTKEVPDGTYPNEHFVYNMLPKDWVDVDGVLYFRGNAGDGYQLWRTNGTPDGTYPVSSQEMYPQYLTQVGGSLYFAWDSGLWKSDGTPDGTVLIKENCSPARIVNINGTLFFNGNDGLNGSELWKSDGSPQGTLMIKDINPAGDSSPDSLTSGNGVVYFTAADGVHDSELWQSDGTAGGTQMVKDLNPSGSSLPAGLTLVNNLLFFSATDGTNGFELWALDLTHLPQSKVYLPVITR